MHSPPSASSRASAPGNASAALRAALAQVAIADCTAPPAWRSVEFIADLHLQAKLPCTVRDWSQYLAASTADAIFLLGDIFEAWPGDDALHEADSFEAQCAATLRQASARHALFFMHGNRDFLIGPHFAQTAQVVLLHDPTCLVFAQQRWLLSHGDALCIDDQAYQHFRTMVRSAAWQQQVLTQPLSQRRQLAQRLRNHSEARRTQQAAQLASEPIYADVDHAAARQWLGIARAPILIHGHTHRPGDHTIDAQHQRVVLSDWDSDTQPARAQVLRLTASGLCRIALRDYLRQPPSCTP